MIFKIQKVDDDRLQADYDRAMKELNEFYGFNWVYNCPQVVIVPDREAINGLKGAKSEDWQIGWTNGLLAFVLDNEAMEANSCHQKHTPEQYYFFIKHELSHIFFRHLAKNGYGPKWFWEGVAIYTSDLLSKKPITKFEKFLDTSDPTGKNVYGESGFAVELLVKKYGKEKLLDLIKGLSECKNQEDFVKKFEEIYLFFPTYEEFNNLMIG